MRREDAIAVVEATFAGWYPTLVRYARRLTGHDGFAEDTVQEVFVRLYEELVAGRPVNNPRAWSLVVVRREIGKKCKTHKVTTSLDDMPALVLSRVCDMEVSLTQLFFFCGAKPSVVIR